jgi:DNA-binding CsgD family transcriptional regulator
MLVGREAELDRARAVLDSAAKGRHVRALRIAGLTGTGKTALANAVADDARAAEWLVAETPNFRIHAALPLFAARRVMQSLLEALGDQAERYESGLTIDRERPDAFAEAFLRLLEGVTLDYRVLLLIDDAQWSDPESRALIASTMTTLADRSIVLLSTERSDEAVTPAFSLVDETVALGNLTTADAAAVVRSIYPEVPDEVASAIAQATRGHAVDLVAVANAARETNARTVSDVSQSTGRIVARDVSMLDPAARAFLQICSLMDEPIELDLLRRIFPNDDVVALAERFSGRYLVTQADGMHFVHAAISQSVRETIPMEIPLRFRIIEAIKTSPSPRLEDYERLVKQSAACGDRELEYQTLRTLSDAAHARGLSSLASDAMERALKLRVPDAAEIVPFYSRLSSLFNLQGRELDCIRTSQQGLAEAERASITAGTGSLVGPMIIAMWHAGRSSDARATLQRYQEAFTEPADRAELASAGMYIAMNCADEALFEDVQRIFDVVGKTSPPIVTTRAIVSRINLALRLGKLDDAEKHLRASDQAFDALPPVLAPLRRSVQAFYHLHLSGIAAAQSVFEGADANPQEPSYLVLQPIVLLARGALRDAADFGFEQAPTLRDPLLRRLMLGPAASAMALMDAASEDPFWSIVQHEATTFESGTYTSALWPVAASYAYNLSRTAPARARHMLAMLLSAMRAPADFAVHMVPVVVAITARQIDDRASLERIVRHDEIWADAHPWGVAHSRLAAGVASAALGQNASGMLSEAAEMFDALGAPFFSTLAREATKPRVSKETAAPPIANTTRREREIAALVADGLTNRQIAERLVLSERTVEGHIANLFAKVDVGSRTQLAAWYLKNVSSVA